MDLYQFEMSPNAKRVRVVAAELGIPLQVKSLDFRSAENKQPDYLAKNPNGKVPTLVDGDFTLWESPAICFYLARKAGKLLGSDPQSEADAVRWMTWNASHFEPHLFTVVFERMFKPMRGGQPDQAKIDHAMKDVERYARILDQQLTGRDWVTGALSIADIAIATSVELAQMAQVDFAPYQAITAWLGRVRERPSWKA
ncbi:MAG TPA: glutathione S-transferase family protein [Kofleriaceae bacterium]|nr:glutathione S-transferase family protein [Kofleriaceae bacterium]